MTSRQPATWAEYECGASPAGGDRASSPGQQSVHFEERSSLLGDERRPSDDGQPGRLRRRSSATNRLAAITDIGGVNSLRSFTRSWQRAAAFPEVIPQQQSFEFAPDQLPVQADPIQYGRSDIEANPQTSLLRQHLEASEQAVADDESGPAGDPTPYSSQHRGGERKGFGHDLSRVISPAGSVRSNSIFEVQPHLASPPLLGSFSSYRTYGTVDSRTSHQSMAQAGELWRQQQQARTDAHGGRPPILVKEVEQDDGTFVLTVCGQSTLPQTVMNSTNVLIGVGLLSLPIGLKYAGWLCGMVALTLCAVVTGWTARLLAKCLRLEPTATTFSDIAYISFGRKARIITSVVFTLELLAACVALVVLFSDSLNLLFPGTMSVVWWKVVCTVLLIPLQFAPLSILSYTSFIGIMCVFSIVMIVIADGFIKTQAPGSLIQPATTYLFPENWLTLPLSFGLLMAPWGGHSVFPSIYRDMRHPHRYDEAVKTTFSFTYLMDATVAIVGYLMFGDGVSDEITSNILKTSGYPDALKAFLVIFIAIIPLTKIPLNAQPIVTTLEVLTGLHPLAVADESTLLGRSSAFRGVMKVMIRMVTLLLFLGIAIAFPGFDTIMAFMGSALCFTICVTLPLAFYLKLFGHELGAGERFKVWLVMTLSFILSVVGTVWAFVPKSLIGAAPVAK